MKLNKTYYKNSDETVYSTKLSNGLNIFLIPKLEYSETAAVFATKFGSVESNAILKLNGNTINGKLGVAHFLEHRMFDNPKGPVFDLFSNLGAISNAFTSFDKTAYYFVASNKLEKNTELLLDFVQGLEIKKESVEKEKGIIIEELKMYLDMPESRLGRGILENLYINHPIKHDIGGTIEEVASTSLEVLQACHQTFYHPNNMVLVIVGQMQIDSIIKVIEKNQNSKTLKPQLKPIFAKINEPLSVKFKYRQIQMPISTKKIAIGYKLKPIDNLSNSEINKRLIAYSIYQDMLFSESAPFYQTLIKSKIITPTMDVSAFQGRGYNAMIVESEVLDEAKFIKAIDEQIKNANVALMEKEFQIVKNLNVSEAIRSYESPQRLAINYMSNYFDGVNVFDDLEAIKNMTLKDIVKVAAEIRQGKKSVFVIKPMVKKLMIKGIGIDLAKISRFENKDQKFVKKILTEAELKQYSELEDERKTQYLAGRFAAKEAYYKAVKNPKLGYHDVEIIDDYFNGPQISDKTARISISHDGEYVVVVVIVED